MSDLDALLTEADEHVASIVNSFAEGSFMRGRILAGEGADQRLSLVVRLAAALRSVQVPVTEEWEIQWAPVAADGQEWALRVEVDCDELIAEHADPTHWVNQPHNDDIYPVVGKRAYRRRPAGPWEPVPSPGTTTEEE